MEQGGPRVCCQAYTGKVLEKKSCLYVQFSLNINWLRCQILWRNPHEFWFVLPPQSPVSLFLQGENPDETMFKWCTGCVFFFIRPLLVEVHLICCFVVEKGNPSQEIGGWLYNNDQIFSSLSFVSPPQDLRKILEKREKRGAACNSIVFARSATPSRRN